MTLVGQPSSLNPINALAECVSCWQIIDLEYAYGMPVMQNGSSDLRNGLFDWMSTNSNASIWYFNIRPGATWSDGLPVNSSDVIFTFGPKSGYLWESPTDFLNLTGIIVSVIALNSSETEFVLSQGYSQFGTILGSQYYFPIVPAHIWESRDFNSDRNLAQDVTDGPFYHLDYNNGTQLILRANPYCWNPPKLSQIVINFVNSSSPDLLISNETDLAQIDFTSVSRFLNDASFGVLTEPDHSILYLEYNITEAPFNNTSFRQALAYSINTTGIVDSVFSGYATAGVLGEGTIPPTATLWHSPQTMEYNYSVTHAEAILTGEGYSKNSAGRLLYPNGTEVSFTIYTDTDVPNDALAAKQVASYLSGMGMNITIIEESLSNIVSDYDSNSTNIQNELVVLSGTSPVFGLAPIDIKPGFQVYYPWFTPPPNWILPSYAETELSNYTEVVNTSTDAATIQQAVRQIDSINSQYLPVIVLAYPDAIWAYRIGSGVTGFPESGYGIDIGGNSLDPFAFTQLECAGSSCLVSTTSSTSLTTTITSTSSNATSSSTSQNVVPPNTNLLEIAIIVIVVAAIASGTILSRRKRVTPPST